MHRKHYNKSTVLSDLHTIGRVSLVTALDAFGQRNEGAHWIAVDATCGNGHDTCFLAEQLACRCPDGSYSILSFDVQEAALDSAKESLCNALAGLCGRVSFLLQSHEHLLHALSVHQKAKLPPGVSPRIVAVMYNLGFLPRSNKTITTCAPVTLASLEQAAVVLAPGGLLSIHAYGGHPGGLEELEAVTRWCSGLPHAQWLVMSHAVCNKPRNPERLFLAWKKAEA